MPHGFVVTPSPPPPGPVAGIGRTLRIGARLVVVAALGVVACETASERVTLAELPAVAEPEREPAPPPTADRSAVEDAAPAAEIAARPPPRRLPPSLIGLDRDRLAEFLGPPRFKRRDNPVEIWQYRAAECTLDLFLYREGNTEVFKVAHVEVRGRGQPKLTADECAVQVLRAGAKSG